MAGKMCSVSLKSLSKFFLTLVLIFACTSSIYGATPAGYSEYYIPGDEVSMFTIFNSLDAAATNTMHTVISVTSWTDNTIVYYDHWEDGYDFDPANPAATADERYVMLTAGDQRTFESANIPTAPRGTATFYDGGDRIYVAGGTVTVTRASWIETVGVGNQSAAWEIYPIKPQLTTYVLPFGENLGFADFNRIYVLVQATENNTTFTVDLNGDGIADVLNQNRDADKTDPGDTTTVTLQRGQTFLLDRVSACRVGPDCIVAPGTLNSGTVIQGSSTLQVKFVAGNPGQTYCARGLSAFPRGYWTKDYYAPLDDPTNAARGNTDYYLYNPHTSALTVNWQSLTASGSFSIPAGSTVSYRAVAGAVPADSGLYFSATDDFWGVGVGNAGGNAYEWGFSLLPSTMLYTEHFLGWAPGSIPLDTAGNPGNQDNNGVFLIAAQDNTRVWVDFDNDGASDLIDADGNGTPESPYVTLNRLQTQFFYDPANAAGGGDLSRAHFWATGPFTMAYGENSDTATTSTPSLDLGYVAIPGSDFVSLVLTVDKAVTPQVITTAAGSQAVFTIKVNSQKYTVNGISVTDYLPANWDFVNDSAQITLPDMTTISGAAANPAKSGSGPYTLDWPSSLLGNMATNQELAITFTAQTTAVLPLGTLSQNRVKAIGTRVAGTETQTFTATDFVYVVTGDFEVAKTSSATGPLYPGDQVDYTVTVTNPVTATTIQTGVSIYDPLPIGTAYVASSGSVTCDLATNVRDEFAAAAYNNNNGSANWAGNWAETDVYGSGATGAAGGYVWITGGQLQLRYLLSNVRDDFTTDDSYSGNYGSNNWTGNWTETGDDGSASSGNILIDNGGNRLSFDQAQVGDTISRTADITGATSATISFSLTDGGIDAGETLIAEYSIDGGGYVNIGTFDGGSGWTGTNPITIALSGNTTLTLRFRAGGNNYDGGEQVYIDNVNIAYNVPASANGSLIQRTANLTGAAAPLLSFSYSSANLIAGDTLVIEAANNPAGPFTTLATFTGGVPSIAPPYDLTPYISANTTVQFRVTGGFNATNKTFSLDNVDITYGMSSTFASANPPDFLLSGTGCQVAPGNSLTLTYSVTVDDPLATGIDEISNTVYVNSNEILLPLSATASNVVVNPSAESAEVGDRVWFDLDGDGVLDVGEPGLSNVEVTLKDQFGTPIATTLTDGTGHFLFTGIEPGNGYYLEVTAATLPAGLQQSAPAGHSDNRSDPFNLIAGESDMAEDIGYRSAPGSAVIGDLVWSDHNSNGIRDAGEPGLGGVNLQLCQDTNLNGILDLGEACASSTSTAADGRYLFTGVAATGTERYCVYIDESQAGLTGYARITPSSNAPCTPALSAGSAALYVDFGYKGTTYTITDRIWFDADMDGLEDAGESGIAGVTVDLLDASLNVIASVTSDANGYFTFSGVAGGGSDYTVRITDTNTILTDYFGTTAAAVAGSKAISNLTGNIDNTPTPSFGYGLQGTVGDTVFNDINGSGTQDAGEPGSSGVVVKLYSDANGNGSIDGADSVVATITSDASGIYLFTGLADGTYIVSIESPPAGFVYTGSDSDPVAAGQQQPATITAGGNSLNRDFGYQASIPRTASGTIWTDADSDGVIDAGETLIAGVTIDLLRNGVVIATTSSAADGTYSFSGLQSGNGYSVRITDNNSVLSGYDTVFEKTEGTTSPFNGEESVDLSGGDQLDVKFGYRKPRPTAVVLSYFGASDHDGRVSVEWSTASENDTAGFYLFRFDDSTGKYLRLNNGLLPGILTAPQGGLYSLIDTGASPGRSYKYLLMEVEGKGTEQLYGPFTVHIGNGNALENEGESDTKPSGNRVNSFSSAPEYPQGNPFDAGVLKYYDKDGTLIVTSRKAAFDEHIMAVTGTDKYAAYTRRARENSIPRAASSEKASMQQVAAGSQQALVPGEMIKIPVSRDGLYFLDAAQISALMGINISTVKQMIRGNTLAMSSQGRSVAYLPSLDSSGLFFYGKGIDSIYTRENMYWLSQGAGRQISYASETGPAPVGSATFTSSVHAEEDKIIVPSVFQDPEADYWMWEYVISNDPANGSRIFPVITDGRADIASTATLTLNLQGFTNTGTANEHHAEVSINGTPVSPAGNGTWTGATPKSIVFEFDQLLLRNGNNDITVTGMLDAGVPYSIFYVDSIDISYQRLHQAADNLLFFNAAAGSSTVTVSGFSNPDIMLLDITDPYSPALQSAVTIDGEAGNYSISFNPASTLNNSSYLAITSDKVIAATNALPVRFVHLLFNRNMADYLVIAPAGLVDAVQPLARYRYRQGLETKVVNLDDIMNEFNFGISSPRAIKDFLLYAYKYWAKPPKYVVLTGEGTYDYKNNLGKSDNMMPPLMAVTPSGLFPGDNLFGKRSGDHGPRIAIGRLPVLSSEELQNVISKIIAVEGRTGNRSILLSDNADSGGNFPEDSNAVKNIFGATPYWGNAVSKIYLSEYSLAAARQMLFDEFRKGAAFLNYLGHGGVDRLATEGLLTASDVALMTSANKLPIVTLMTCSTGQFAVPGFDSLGETLLLKKDGGAAAVWSPSGLPLNSLSRLLAEEFYQAALYGKGPRLGDAILKTIDKFVGSGQPEYVTDIYNLLGDPALKLW
ncbi:MAG: DUF11 domain-containing protein [Nitrospirae bacterium]|nr:DUF11 domain-containing protein [Nitrospirota bacterium]